MCIDHGCRVRLVGKTEVMRLLSEGSLLQDSRRVILSSQHFVNVLVGSMQAFFYVNDKEGVG